jgi:KAP family P-loop domain
MSAYKLFPPNITVGPRDGFKPEIDVFGRKYIGDGIKNLFETVSDPLVLCVNGEWGTGKTTFLKMLEGELLDKGFPVIAFDAFESDYIDDPFIAISSRIFDELVAREHKSDADRFKKTAVKLGKLFGRTLFDIGVKVVTANALDGSKIEGLAEKASDALAEMSDKHFGEAITANKEREKTISDFKNLLSDAHSGNLSEAGGFRPLVIIIDEIDRCRPDFALKLIERIKHFFSVPNVQFILGANLRQLEKSVGAQYGLGLDARTYLQKFISLIVPIADTGLTTSYSMPTDSQKYASSLLQHSGVSRAHHYSNTISNLLLKLIGHRDLPLRSVEKLITKIALVCALESGGQRQIGPFYFILADLAYISLFDSETYARLKGGIMEYDALQHILGLGVGVGVPTSTNELDTRRSVWRYFCNIPTQEEKDYLEQSFQSYMQRPTPTQLFQSIARETMDTVFTP